MLALGLTHSVLAGRSLANGLQDTWEEKILRHEHSLRAEVFGIAKDT